MYEPESLTLCWVRSQISDHCGLSGFVTKLFDRRLIIPHGLALSGCWAVTNFVEPGRSIGPLRLAEQFVFFLRRVEEAPQVRAPSLRMTQDDLAEAIVG